MHTTDDDEKGNLFFVGSLCLLSIIKYGIMLKLPIKMYNSKWIFECESADPFPIGLARMPLSRFIYFLFVGLIFIANDNNN